MGWTQHLITIQNIYIVTLNIEFSVRVDLDMLKMDFQDEDELVSCKYVY